MFLFVASVSGGGRGWRGGGSDEVRGSADRMMYATFFFLLQCGGGAGDGGMDLEPSCGDRVVLVVYSRCDMFSFANNNVEVKMKMTTMR